MFGYSMFGYNRFENGDYDHLVIDPDGVVCIEYLSGGCLKHEPVHLYNDEPLHVGGYTTICDRRKKYVITRYKLKHK